MILKKGNRHRVDVGRARTNSEMRIVVKSKIVNAIVKRIRSETIMIYKYNHQVNQTKCQEA